MNTSFGRVPSARGASRSSSSSPCSPSSSSTSLRIVTPATECSKGQLGWLISSTCASGSQSSSNSISSLTVIVVVLSGCGRHTRFCLRPYQVGFCGICDRGSAQNQATSALPFGLALVRDDRIALIVGAGLAVPRCDHLL